MSIVDLQGELLSVSLLPPFPTIISCNIFQLEVGFTQSLCSHHSFLIELFLAFISVPLCISSQTELCRFYKWCILRFWFVPFINKRHWGFIIMGVVIPFLIKSFDAFTFSVITGIFSLFLFTLKTIYSSLFLLFWGVDSIFYYSASAICIDISYTQISVHLAITMQIISSSLARTKCNVSYKVMKMFRNNFPLTTLIDIRYYMFSYIIGPNSVFF